MARSTITKITDDLDGSADAEEVRFSYDGVDYTIDLSRKNRAALDKALKPYIRAATRVSRRRRQQQTSTGRQRRGSSASPPLDTAAVRAWAAGQGIEVSPRGRLRKTVIDAYHDANGAEHR